MRYLDRPRSLFALGTLGDGTPARLDGRSAPHTSLFLSGSRVSTQIRNSRAPPFTLTTAEVPGPVTAPVARVGWFP